MFRFSLLLIVLIVLIISCQYRPSLPPDIPPLTICKITVTQNGEPLDGASVILHSVSEMETWRVSGVTNANGVAVLFTNGLFEGVPQGKYKITVSKAEQETDDIPPCPESGSHGYEEWMKKYENIPRSSNTYSLVEKQYSMFSVTPLEIDVSGKKVIEMKIDVGKKVREKL
ncbi:MAG: carboxypeptidase-like regulatory domain-containing protein [Planctomycetaceae bacterium]|jgi:hypothetical protein|nr:carboxypeptidase-like regulatory domain-containing protein [Planctomycetaceae bacterium]